MTTVQAAKPTVEVQIHTYEEMRRKEIAHDDLVKALEDIIYDCESDYPPSYGAIKQAAKQALAKSGA